MPITPDQIHNTLLLYPIMGNNTDPTVRAVEIAEKLWAAHNVNSHWIANNEINRQLNNKVC